MSEPDVVSMEIVDSIILQTMHASNVCTGTSSVVEVISEEVITDSTVDKIR